jgi:hypothetical protein
LSKGGSNVTQAESWSDIPERYRDFVDENLSLAGTLGNRAYTPYQGQRVAGFTDDQNAAFNTVRQLPNQYGGMVANANQALTNAATPVQPQGYNPATFQASQAQAAMMPSAQGYDAASGASNMAQYQNPFTEQVINAGMNDLNRSYQMSLSGIGARAAGAGAYGGSRQGVAEAEAAKNFMDSAGQLSAGLRSQGFNTAAGLGQGDAASQNASRAVHRGIAERGGEPELSACHAGGACQRGQPERGARSVGQRDEPVRVFKRPAGERGQSGERGEPARSGSGVQRACRSDADARHELGERACGHRPAAAGLNQAQMDLNYGDFLQEYNYPYQALALRQSAIGQTPMGQVGMQPVVTQSGGAGGLLGGLGGLLEGGAALAPFICWVAREVYGEDDPQWLRFREWMLSKAPESLRRFYIENGERIAAYISDKPDLKSEIRGMMDELVPGVAS